MIEKLDLEVSVNNTIRSFPELIKARFAVGNLSFAFELLQYLLRLDVRQVYGPAAGVLSVLDQPQRVNVSHQVFPILGVMPARSADVVLEPTLTLKENADGVPTRSPRYSRDKSLFLASLS